MREEICTTEALIRTFAGEKFDTVVDDISSRLGQEENEESLHLRRLSRIWKIMLGYICIGEIKETGNF